MRNRALSALLKGIAAFRGSAPELQARPRDLAAELNATLPQETRQPLLRHVRERPAPTAVAADEPTLAWLGAEYAREYPQPTASAAFGR